MRRNGAAFARSYSRKSRRYANPSTTWTGRSSSLVVGVPPAAFAVSLTGRPHNRTGGPAKREALDRASRSHLHRTIRRPIAEAIPRRRRSQGHAGKHGRRSTSISICGPSASIRHLRASRRLRDRHAIEVRGTCALFANKALAHRNSAENLDGYPLAASPLARRGQHVAVREEHTAALHIHKDPDRRKALNHAIDRDEVVLFQANSSLYSV